MLIYYGELFQCISLHTSKEIVTFDKRSEGETSVVRLELLKSPDAIISDAANKNKV